MGERGAYQIFRILRAREDEIYVTSRDSLNAAKAYVAKLMCVAWRVCHPWPGFAKACAASPP